MCVSIGQHCRTGCLQATMVFYSGYIRRQIKYLWKDFFRIFLMIVYLSPNLVRIKRCGCLKSTCAYSPKLSRWHRLSLLQNSMSFEGADLALSWWSGSFLGIILKVRFIWGLKIKQWFFFFLETCPYHVIHLKLTSAVAPLQVRKSWHIVHQWIWAIFIIYCLSIISFS